MEKENFDTFAFGGGELPQEASPYEDVETLIRQKQKGKIFEDSSRVLEGIARRRKVYISLGRKGLKFMKFTVNDTFKDYKKSIKQINEKIPICVEVPTYKKEKGDDYSVTSAETGEKETVTPEKKSFNLFGKKKEQKAVDTKAVDVLDFTKEE